MNKPSPSIKLLAAIAGTLSLVGVAGLPLQADPVLDSPSARASHDVGCLKVYSATEQWPDGDSTYRYIHTNYRIRSFDGKFAKWVNNQDEDPNQVTLPRGDYIVEAQSEQYGWIRIKLVIRTGRTATVHLERPKDWDEDLTFVPKSDLIRLPDGNLVGVYE